MTKEKINGKTTKSEAKESYYLQTNTTTKGQT
jgi:hypothetical protein